MSGLRWAATWLLYLTGVARVARWLNRDKLVVVCFHGVTHRGEGMPGDHAGLQVRADRFRRQLRYLGSRYSVISLEDYGHAAAHGGVLPRNPLLITFDDGLRNCLTAALPLLVAEGLPATFFVITDLMRDADGQAAQWTPADDSTVLSWGEAVRLSSQRGYEIGSHTASHKWLPALDDDGLTDELHDAADQITRRFGASHPALAYPWGGRDARVLRAAGKVHAVAFTTDGMPNPADAEQLELARVLVGDHDGRAALALRTAGVSRPSRPAGPPSDWENWSPGAAAG